MSEDADAWKYSAAVAAIICPPVAVYISKGGFETTVMINIFLSLLLWIPGVIHAFYVVSNTSDDGNVDGQPPAT